MATQYRWSIGRWAISDESDFNPDRWKTMDKLAKINAFTTGHIFKTWAEALNWCYNQMKKNQMIMPAIKLVNDEHFTEGFSDYCIHYWNALWQVQKSIYTTFNQMLKPSEIVNYARQFIKWLKNYLNCKLCIKFSDDIEDKGYKPATEDELTNSIIISMESEDIKEAFEQSILQCNENDESNMEFEFTNFNDFNANQQRFNLINMNNNNNSQLANDKIDNNTESHNTDEKNEYATNQTQSANINDKQSIFDNLMTPSTQARTTNNNSNVLSSQLQAPSAQSDVQAQLAQLTLLLQAQAESNAQLQRMMEQERQHRIQLEQQMQVQQQPLSHANPNNASVIIQKDYKKESEITQKNELWKLTLNRLNKFKRKLSGKAGADKDGAASFLAALSVWKDQCIQDSCWVGYEREFILNIIQNNFEKGAETEITNAQKASPIETYQKLVDVIVEAWELNTWHSQLKKQLENFGNTMQVEYPNGLAAGRIVKAFRRKMADYEMALSVATENDTSWLEKADGEQICLVKKALPHRVKLKLTQHINFKKEILNQDVTPKTLDELDAILVKLQSSIINEDNDNVFQDPTSDGMTQMNVFKPSYNPSYNPSRKTTPRGGRGKPRGRGRGRGRDRRDRSRSHTNKFEDSDQSGKYDANGNRVYTPPDYFDGQCRKKNCKLWGHRDNRCFVMHKYYPDIMIDYHKRKGNNTMNAIKPNGNESKSDQPSQSHQSKSTNEGNKAATASDIFGANHS